jgi:hypothetical protein
LRAPPRRIPIKRTRPRLGIWEILDRTEATTTIKDIILNDKEIQAELRDGLRFIMGRKKTNVKKMTL